MSEPDNLPIRRGDRTPERKGAQELTDPAARAVGFPSLPGSRVKTIALALAVGLVLSDSSIVVLALPDILARYSLTIGEVSWVLTGFNIVLALVAVPVAYVVRRRAPDRCQDKPILSQESRRRESSIAHPASSCTQP